VSLDHRHGLWWKFPDTLGGELGPCGEVASVDGVAPCAKGRRKTSCMVEGNEIGNRRGRVDGIAGVSDLGCEGSSDVGFPKEVVSGSVADEDDDARRVSDANLGGGKSGCTAVITQLGDGNKGAAGWETRENVCTTSTAGQGVMQM
jgi:hypothetical protein